MRKVGIEWLLVLGACALAPAVRFLPQGWLKVSSFTEPLDAWPEVPESSSLIVAERFAAIERGCQLVPFYLSCLHRSVIACILLRGLGYPAVLCLGAKKLGDMFEAHAWVRVGQQSFGELLSEPHPYRELRKNSHNDSEQF